MRLDFRIARRAHTIGAMTGRQWPPGEPGNWLRRGALSLMLAAAVAGSVPEALPDRFQAQRFPVAASPRIRLDIGGRQRWVPLGWTLADAIHRFRLQPRAGSLRAVDGGVLRPDAFPGRVLLNGRAAPRGTWLEAGARISLQPGADRVEPLARLVLQYGPDEPHDPQFSLETGPGRETLTSGAISRRGVATVFQPSGAVRQPNAVALTFDDGPWPDSTGKVLGILAKAHVKATFFLVGTQVRKHPEIAREELRAGMTLGSHSFSHPQPFGALSTEGIDREIDQGLAALSELGVRTPLFRPPGGAIPPVVVSAARARGLRTIVWSVDPDDWRRGTTSDQIVERVLQQARPGSIVLLHDGGGDRSATVEALPRIIDGLKRRRLAFVTL
jgi:peptidoglycan/xylan/chitin deacetylase (PgdA/CDA1 family)